jgi:hypothetical protein
MRLLILLLFTGAFAFCTTAGAAPKSSGGATTPKIPARSLNGIPGSQLDEQKAARMEELMRLRALQNRRGRGGAPQTGAPIILNGGPPALAPPAPANEQPKTATKKSSKERRAAAKVAAAERKRLKKEEAEKAKAEKAKKPAKAGKKPAPAAADE